MPGGSRASRAEPPRCRETCTDADGQDLYPEVFERRPAIARPPRPILSRDLIARTALALVDRHGVDGASMRRVAQKLGVNPASLYNHVPDRATMIEDVRALVSAKIDSSPLRKMPWEEGLVAWARSYRQAFARHHRAVPLLMTNPVSAPVLLAEYEDFVVAAESVGWPTAEVLPLLTAFESFILGSVLDMSGPSIVYDPTGQEDRFPRFAAAYSTLRDQPSDDPIATRAFERGLQMLVNSARPEGHGQASQKGLGP